MNSLLFLVPISVALLVVAIGAFVWAVRRGQFDAKTHRVEQVNWAGLITLVAAAALGMILMHTEVMPLGFLMSLVAALIGELCARNLCR